MSEHQNIENSDLAREDQVYLWSSEREEFGRSQYKSSCYDDYLKWVCGLANTEACFRGGYIDSWGSGNLKIMDSCKAAGLPTPMIEEDCGGLIVRLFKDRFSEEQLKELGLNDRQIKAVFYVKEKGKITNSEYQTLNSVSKRTATNDLSELVDKTINSCPNIKT